MNWSAKNRGRCGQARLTAADLVLGWLRNLTRMPAALLLELLRLYQLVISPLTGASCRYYPSCSAYAIQAVNEHGAVRGAGLTIGRLLRCNPFSRGGVDHVPPRFNGYEGRVGVSGGPSLTKPKEQPA